MVRCGRLIGAFVLVAIAGLMSFGSVQAQETETFTLEPGGTATITFEAFCTNFGQNFPDTIGAPDALAQPEVRNALAYIAAQSFAGTPADALDAQYGLWRVVGAADSPQGEQIAADVVNAANTAVQDPEGTSLLDAVEAGQVTVTVDSWEPLGEPVQIGDLTDHFYGRGTMTVQNTSNETLNLYHPIGALYPPQTAGDQTMAGYATDIQVQNPQPTAQPTQQATQQPTQQATQQPTQQATQPTSAAQASATDQQPTQLPETSAGFGTALLPILTSLALGAMAVGLRTVRRSRRKK